MKKLMLLVALVAVAFVVSSASEAKADHMSGGCRGGFMGVATATRPPTTAPRFIPLRFTATGP